MGEKRVCWVVEVEIGDGAWDRVIFDAEPDLGFTSRDEAMRAIDQRPRFRVREVEYGGEPQIRIARETEFGTVPPSRIYPHECAIPAGTFTETPPMVPSSGPCPNTIAHVCAQPGSLQVLTCPKCAPAPAWTREAPKEGDGFYWVRESPDARPEPYQFIGDSWFDMELEGVGYTLNADAFEHWPVPIPEPPK